MVWLPAEFNAANAEHSNKGPEENQTGDG